MDTSKRIKELNVSPIRKLIPYAEQCEDRGIDVIKLNIGQPDIETPQEYIDAIKDYDGKVLEYVHSRGLNYFIDTIINYYKRFGLDYKFDDIIVTQGASEALMYVMMTICDLEDEILVFEPFYANYNNFADIVNVKLVPVTTYAEDGFRIPDLKTIEKSLTKKTRGVLISNPSNPTGRIYSKEELDTLAELAIKYDLFIISDEVYKEFNYTDEKFFSFGNYSNLEDRVILVDSISKRFSCCGARIGNIATKNKGVIEGFMKLAQARLSVATLEQHAAAALEKVSPEYIRETKRRYKARRDLLVDRLSKMPGVLTNEPNGAFYSIVKLPVDDAEKFVIWTLENISINDKTVLITPAKGFYLTPGLGENEVRISYCVNTDILSDAMDILELALNKYPNRTV
ncbi:MAG: pyridoxal phosphate-dependent aminotransferase [Tissierellia bacterium]|nr:pyridoxal phosphate-dependent aminotransferase [Tissierellia bacterium]